MIRKIFFLFFSFTFIGWINPANAQIFNSSNTELMNNIIYTMSADREGCVWVGTDNGGFYDGLVSICNVNDTKFDSRRYTSQESGSFLNIIYCIAVEDSVTNPKVTAPVKWIGTSFGLVSFNGSEWKQHSGLPNKFVNCIAFDSDANKWIGTNKGLAKYDGKNMTVYNTTNAKLPSDRIQSVFIDSKNNIWVGTDKGLAKFDGNGWTTFTTEGSPLPHDYIFSITEDKNQNIWIGTNGGVTKFDGTSTKKKRWTVFTVNNSDLPNDMIRDIFIEETGKIWIATLNGLAVIDNDTWTIYNKENSGLPENKIKEIVADAAGRIWIGTVGGGIAIMKIATLTE